MVLVTTTGGEQFVVAAWPGPWPPLVERGERDRAPDHAIRVDQALAVAGGYRLLRHPVGVVRILTPEHIARIDRIVP